MIIDKLTSEHAAALLKVCPPCLYPIDSDLVHEGHVPMAGYYLLEGEIKLVKNKKVIKTLGAGTLFGVHEILNKLPIKYSIKIQGNSKVCVLDRSTVKELLHRIEQNEFPRIFEALVV